jgi:CheY-like chemotaxis protein
MEKIESILLVDDDPICNFLHSRLIKKLDITDHIQISLNGREALNYIDNESEFKKCPQLIFLDINMPVMNGIEFLQIYTEGNHCIGKPVIIILTTSHSTQDLEKCKSYFHVNGYLNKPLTPEKIDTVLKAFFS